MTKGFLYSFLFHSGLIFALIVMGATGVKEKVCFVDLDFLPTMHSSVLPPAHSPVFRASLSSAHSSTLPTVHSSVFPSALSPKSALSSVLPAALSFPLPPAQQGNTTEKNITGSTPEQNNNNIPDTIQRVSGNNPAVSVNLNSFNPIPYYINIRTKITGNQFYPETARRRNMEGKTQVKFVVGEAGNLISVNVINSSGSQLLDSAAISSIRKSCPFPSFPSDFGAKEICFFIIFNYKLN
jgi:TonB family protein